MTTVGAAGGRKRCAIYARVSRERQAEQNLSIPDQIARARAYAEIQKWDVVSEYIDPGASGTDDAKRPKFREMIAEAVSAHRPFDFILVHSFSRFYRDQAKSELVRRDLKKNRVEVRSLTQEIKDDGAGGTFALAIMGLLDEYQSRENAKHVRRAMEANAREGFRNGGATPFGYRLQVAEVRGQRSKRKLAIDPAEASVVESIFDRHQRGIGVKEITKQLNAEGIRTSNGGQWYTSTVARVLTNDAYVGRTYHKGKDPVTGELNPREQWVEVPCPPIISETVFRSVQEQLAARAPNVTAPRFSTSPVLLGGIAYCGSCGRHLVLATGTGKKGKVYRYYKCVGRLKNGACDGGQAVSIREDELDDMVMETITAQLMTPERVQAIVAEVCSGRSTARDGVADRVKALKLQLSQLKREEKNLWDLAASLGLQMDEGFKDKLADVQDRKRHLEGHIAAQEALLADAIQPLDTERATLAAAKMRRWARHADISIRRRYVQSLVAKVIVGDDVRIIGQKSTVAEAANDIDIAGDATANRVRGFDREWWSRGGSNP